MSVRNLCDNSVHCFMSPPYDVMCMVLSALLWSLLISSKMHQKILHRGIFWHLKFCFETPLKKAFKNLIFFSSVRRTQKWSMTFAQAYNDLILKFVNWKWNFGQFIILNWMLRTWKKEKTPLKRLRRLKKAVLMCS